MPEPLNDLSPLALAHIVELAAQQKMPPVSSWNPTRSGDSYMVIKRDGTWLHEGAPINRPAMVRLFSSILRREADGSHVLVTPAERLSIEVEDTPFIAVEVKSEGEGEGRTLAFRLNTGPLVVAGPDHPITVSGLVDLPEPRLRVHGGMDARITRAIFYELATIAIEEARVPLGLWSGGEFFALGANPC
jgi:uncharacterized protein